MIRNEDQYAKITEILRKREIEYVRTSVASSQIIKLFVCVSKNPEDFLQL